MSKSKNKGGDMSFMGHLSELRKRLTVMVAATLLATLGLFYVAPQCMRYLLALKPETMELVYITPSELLLVYIQLSFLMALILCAPINLYEVWAFLEKGLYKHEKMVVLLSLLFGLLFFVGGVLFGYFTVLPVTLEFFSRIEAQQISAMISVKSYVSFVNTMLLAFGVVFEMPIVVFLLTRLGILSPAFLKRNRGVLIIVIFVLAAIITPPDVVSQLLLALPMLVLLQFSIFISTLVDKGNQRRRAAAEKDEDSEEEA